MIPYLIRFLWKVLPATCVLTLAIPLNGQLVRRIYPSDQHQLPIPPAEAISYSPLSPIPSPPTVADPQSELPSHFLSLDEAIRTALSNARVIRILTGLSASNSGATIYDPAISNAQIDREKARFDPRLDINNTFQQNDLPRAEFDPLILGNSRIRGTKIDNYTITASVAKTIVTGTDVSFNVNSGRSAFSREITPLNPQFDSSADVTVAQPLMRGAGVAANIAPIIAARIETERSYFQFKDSVQEMVRGVIEAYWAIVFARTDVWARTQQVDQAAEAYERAAAQERVGIADRAVAAQTKTAWASFRANLVAAKGNLLQREAAFRNILGFPPSDSGNIVPISPPRLEKMDVDWNNLVQMAEVHRPDLIELKLVIEADEQLLIRSRNQAQPNLDAIARYRWNGIEGEMPNGNRLASRDGQFTDWTLGVNFSVPLGLRQGRATLRQQELLLARDRVNLEQGQHAALHILAGNLRNLDQFYEQYVAFREARLAAFENQQLQSAEYRNNRTNFITVLQAITDWGNSLSAEAQSIVQYNIELANLERQTGTILEAHGIRFVEEQYGSIGPLGRWQWLCYPESLTPTPNAPRYPADGANLPAEEVFELTRTKERGRAKD